MKQFTILVVTVLSSIATLFGLSLEPPKPREFKSPSGEYRFVMNPPELTTRESFFALAQGDYLGSCMREPDAETKSLVPYGILYHGRKSETRLWKRPLVNQVCPNAIFLAETPENIYIVTFGNWDPSPSGAEHELVIYDRGARLIKTFTAQQLGISKKAFEGPFLWYSAYNLEPKTATLLVTLRETNKILRISLQTGAILGTP
jgi:hypothetical protein